MRRLIILATAAAIPVLLAGCDVAPKESFQNGYRGTGMNTVMVKASAAADDVPEPPYDPPGLDGQRAGEVYQNVQVLGDVSEEQFTYTMAAITAWVSPEQGCNYCHNPENMASDEKYTKVAARKMLQMTRNINSNWNKHVANTGVTCWTCHRGNAIPANYWALPDAGKNGIIGNRHGQNNPVAASAYSSLPEASLALYLTGDPKTDRSIRVVSDTLHPTKANELSIKETEPQYALMNHLSTSLGVNCTFCHNAQAFKPWNISTPKRATAWYGLPSWLPFAQPMFAEEQPGLKLDFPVRQQGRRQLPDQTWFFEANGTITNISQTSRSVPPILLVLRDGRKRVVYTAEIMPSKRVLAPGESVQVNQVMVPVPPAGTAAEFGWKPGS